MLIILLCYSPLQASQVYDPSAYRRKSDHSPHSSQYPDTFLGDRPISPLINNAFSETTSNNSGVTARTSDTEIILPVVFMSYAKAFYVVLP